MDRQSVRRKGSSLPTSKAVQRHCILYTSPPPSKPRNPLHPNLPPPTTNPTDPAHRNRNALTLLVAKSCARIPATQRQCPDKQNGPPSITSKPAWQSQAVSAVQAEWESDGAMDAMQGRARHLFDVRRSALPRGIRRQRL
jgi:hypothetical protein